MATRPDQDPKETGGQDGRDNAFVWDGPTAPWAVSDNDVGRGHKLFKTRRSPRVKWMIDRIEGVFARQCNQITFGIYKSSGKVTKDDLSTFLAASGVQSELPPSQLPQNAQAGPNEPLPFVCRSPGGCKCDPPLPSESLGLYQDLPSGNHLRILEVLPGLSGVVECILHVGRLPEDSYTYEALSYTWDLDYWTPKEASSLPIRCNGLDIPVGINLANALWRLRRKHVSRMVWTDALCINQMDIAEKENYRFIILLTVLSSVQRDEDHVWFTKDNGSDKGKFNITIPSWVPQWNVLLTRSLTPPHGIGFAASLDTYLRRQHTDDLLKLKLRGILIDSVVNCAYSGGEFQYNVHDLPRYFPLDLGDVSKEELGDFDTEDQIQKINNPLKELLQNPEASEKHLEKVSLTLTAGQNWYGFPVQDVSVHLADYVCCLLDGGLWWSLEKDAFTGPKGYRNERILSTEEKMVLRYLARCWNLEPRVKRGNAQRFLDVAATLSSQRARFTISSGMIGIGPKAMQQDDLLCILYGTAVPFVIRPGSDGTGYILIGECYIYDVMLGDAVKYLDSLPSRTSHGVFWTDEAWIELY
ncbi:hypothetical protein GQ44DRAFT_777478 [Phaeosphaeriaceae sp. PMI808]|nr:hypothetical protein GQ44DRAFT_777478 [Phaeosphaeriaceae sp. PMI808]